MIYLKEFDSHSSYETELNRGGSEATITKISGVKPSGATIVTGQTI